MLKGVQKNDFPLFLSGNKNRMTFLALVPQFFMFLPNKKIITVPWIIRTSLAKFDFDEVYLLLLQILKFQH